MDKEFSNIRIVDIAKMVDVRKSVVRQEMVLSMGWDIG